MPFALRPFSNARANSGTHNHRQHVNAETPTTPTSPRRTVRRQSVSSEAQHELELYLETHGPHRSAQREQVTRAVRTTDTRNLESEFMNRRTRVRDGPTLLFLREAFDPSAHAKPRCPPASTNAIQKLPHARVLPWHRSNNELDATPCGICQERLMDGIALSRLPCGHVYHINCIVPWLTVSCTCPECRYELPTNDADFERGREERMKDRKIFQCDCKSTFVHECFFVPATHQQCMPCHPEATGEQTLALQRISNATAA